MLYPAQPVQVPCIQVGTTKLWCTSIGKTRFVKLFNFFFLVLKPLTYKCVHTSISTFVCHETVIDHLSNMPSLPTVPFSSEPFGAPTHPHMHARTPNHGGGGWGWDGRISLAPKVVL